MNFSPTRSKLGILGGGQLGLMIIPEALKLGVETHILDPDPNCSCKNWCSNLTIGDFKDYQTVLDFGRKVDFITIEIEQVNVEALKVLVREGKFVFPQPNVIELIQDKGLQKDFYTKHGIPTSNYYKVDSFIAVNELIESNIISFPFVHKSRQFGYDGKGVNIIKENFDLKDFANEPSIVEEMVDIEKELSVVVTRGMNGEMKSFPTVEMVFHPTANLVEFLRCPADIDDRVGERAKEVAEKVAESFGIVGILAVELFLTKSGDILVNEVAPRVHNSGHHTIQSTVVSQFEQHLRAVLGLPLGSTEIKMPSVMVNILGEEGYSGSAFYQGLNEVLSIEGCSVHLYGKKQTKPFRKMGHATIVARNLEDAITRSKIVAKTLKCISNEQ